MTQHQHQDESIVRSNVHHSVSCVLFGASLAFDKSDCLLGEKFVSAHYLSHGNATPALRGYHGMQHSVMSQTVNDV